MKRRNFIRVSFAVACALALKIRVTGRRILYPGRVVSLDEDSLKQMAQWMG